MDQKKIFIDEDPFNSKTICKITDNEDYLPFKHKKSLDPKIPNSLKESIISFYLVNAIFYLRGIYETKDISMMINVSLFTAVLEQLKLEIIRYKAKIDNFNVDMQVNENFIILDQKSYEINRYTLRFNHYYGNRAYPGACKKLTKKKI